jgi:hypothetical protein
LNSSLDRLPPSSPSHTTLALIAIVPIMSLLALLFAGYSFHNYRRKSRINEVPTSEDPLIDSCPPSPYVGLRPIQLMEARAQGKFGSVWRVSLHFSLFFNSWKGMLFLNFLFVCSYLILCNDFLVKLIWKRFSVFGLFLNLTLVSLNFELNINFRSKLENFLTQT